MARLRAERRHHAARLKRKRATYNNRGAGTPAHIGMVYRTPLQLLLPYVAVTRVELMAWAYRNCVRGALRESGGSMYLLQEHF